MSARYEVGELVDVLIRNGRIVEADATGVMVEAKNMDAMWLDLSAVQVTRVAPKEWPPQPGDVWEDRDGMQWFARRDEFMGVKLVGDGAEGPAERAEAVLRDGPLRLLYRRGWSPKPAPAGPPAAAEPERLAPEDPREAAIQGLREMADWLEATPQAPLPYFPGIRVFVENMLHGNGGAKLDKAAGIALLRDLAATTGVVLREEVHLTFEHEFAGGVSYEAMLCNWAEPTETSWAGDSVTSPEVPAVATTQPGDPTLLAAGGEVAGPGVGPATAPAESAAGSPCSPADGAPDAVAMHDGGASAAVPAPDCNGDGAAVTPDEPEVWVPIQRRGINHHLVGVADVFTLCGRAARASGSRLPRSEAEAFGATPCPRCYGTEG